MSSRFPALCVSLCLCAVLAACSKGSPTETEVKSSQMIRLRLQAATEAQLAAAAASSVGKLHCKPVAQHQDMVDCEFELAGQPATMRFQRTGSGDWSPLLD